MHYELLVDGANFGTIRDMVLRGRSPISEILFISRVSLLPEVARLLDGEDGRTPDARQRYWETLLRTRQVEPEVRLHGFGVDSEAIEHEANCQVIYLPPVYLVHLVRSHPGGAPFRR